MVSLISTGSNYIIVIMGVIYAITCFTVFLPSTEKRQVKRMDRQELFMFVFHFICYGVLFAKTLDTKIIFLYLAQVVFFKMLIFVYSRVYVDCSRILMNHTCFLLLIGFVMLTRLSFDKAVYYCCGYFIDCFIYSVFYGKGCLAQKVEMDLWPPWTDIFV